MFIIRGWQRLAEIAWVREREWSEMRWCLALVREMLMDMMRAVALNELVQFGLAKTIMGRTRE